MAWWREIVLLFVDNSVLQRYAKFNRLLQKDFLLCYSCLYYSYMILCISRYVFQYYWQVVDGIFLAMSSFCEMQIVSWGDSIKISDSLLVFVPLLVDLTGNTCARFWSCVSKNCSKKSIAWINREISVCSRVLLGT